MGFRAAMLAHYLWGESEEDVVREKVCDVALWVADKALLGLMQFTQLEENPAPTSMPRTSTTASTIPSQAMIWLPS